MATLSFQIRGVPTTHELPALKEAARHQQGATINIYERNQVGAPALGSALVFIHVTDIPTPDAGSIRHLAEPVMLGEALLHRHKTQFLLQNATPEEITTLTQNREMESTWTRAKEVLWHHGWGRLIVDSDLNG